MGRMGALDWDNLMAQPRITVLMPVWNGEAYLSQALASILRQTHDDFELLVVDDGSTDRTAEILTACHDSRLRMLRNETRRKLSGALNRGIAEARGEFIARMDADDLMRPDRLARQVACLERNSDWICCGGAVRTLGCGSGTILRYPCEPAELPAFCLFYAPFAHPTVMFRREWFQRAGLAYDGAYYPAEDYELWTRILRQFPAGNLPQVSEIAPLLIIIKLEELNYGGAAAVAVAMLVISFTLLLAINTLQAWSNRHQQRSRAAPALPHPVLQGEGS